MEIRKGILLIGFGRHIEDKILPAIRQLKINVLGIVSQNKNIPKDISHFKNYDDFRKENFNPTHIFIGTSPDKHLNLVNEFGDCSNKIMVEKPLILKNCNFDLKNLITSKNIILKEAMMYQYNFLNSFLRKRRQLINNAKEIEAIFTIPLDSLGNNKSFRNRLGIENSMLFDIGCYIYDFIWCFNMSNNDFQIYEKKFFKNGKPEFLFLKSKLKHSSQKLFLKFGYSQSYRNEVKFISKYNISYTLKPFFYGRKSEVEIGLMNAKKRFAKKYINENCFVKMINDWYVNKDTIVQKQLSNINRILFVQNSLTELSKILED